MRSCFVLFALGTTVGQGEKARRKFSSTGGRAPVYRLSLDHFQTVERMLAPDWAQKMLCIIVPNRRTVSPEFFSWVRTRRLLSRHSCPVRSPSFPNQKRRNYRWVEKRFGCYQQEQFNLHWENPVSDGSQCIANNRTFKTRRRRESGKSNNLTRRGIGASMANKQVALCWAGGSDWNFSSLYASNVFQKERQI